jgi:hypothetical protein
MPPRGVLLDGGHLQVRQELRDAGDSHVRAAATTFPTVCGAMCVLGACDGLRFVQMEETVSSSPHPSVSHNG